MSLPHTHPVEDLADPIRDLIINLNRIPNVHTIAALTGSISGDEFVRNGCVSFVAGPEQHGDLVGIIESFCESQSNFSFVDTGPAEVPMPMRWSCTDYLPRARHIDTVDPHYYSIDVSLVPGIEESNVIRFGPLSSDKMQIARENIPIVHGAWKGLNLEVVEHIKSTIAEDIESLKFIDYTYPIPRIEPDGERLVEDIIKEFGLANKRKKYARAAKAMIKSLSTPTPVQINMLPLYVCNLDCFYCDQNNPGSMIMTFENFEKLVRSARSLDAGYFNYTGGEPMLWRHIFSSIAYLSGHNFGSHMTTNGFRLNDNAVEKLSLAGLDVLNLSLDGIDSVSGSHKVLSKHSPGFTNRLRRLRSNGTLIKLNSVLSNYSLVEIPKIVSYAMENNFVLSLGLEVPAINKAIASGYRPVGFMERFSEHPEAEKAYNAIMLASQNGILIEPLEYFQNPTFDCNIGKHKTLSVGPELEIMHCFKDQSMKSGLITDLRESNYPEYLETQSDFIDSCNPACASNCAYMGAYYNEHKVPSLVSLAKKARMSMK
ncbi:radical SAM protein [archaeon]|nr:radical SAM protein [archaeon]MBL7057471.1 radical SAM protein [Candidatus Woesearchaeota archaeon]